jgi:hypothetical protein
MSFAIVFLKLWIVLEKFTSLFTTELVPSFMAFSAFLIEEHLLAYLALKHSRMS